MFALIDLEGANSIALKCDPERAIELRDYYTSIEGASHFNKKYWNRITFGMDADDKLIKELIIFTAKAAKDRLIFTEI